VFKYFHGFIFCFVIPLMSSMEISFAYIILTTYIINCDVNSHQQKMKFIHLNATMLDMETIVKKFNLIIIVLKWNATSLLKQVLCWNVFLSFFFFHFPLVFPSFVLWTLGSISLIFCFLVLKSLIFYSYHALTS